MRNAFVRKRTILFADRPVSPNGTRTRCTPAAPVETGTGTPSRSTSIPAGAARGGREVSRINVIAATGGNAIVATEPVQRKGVAGCPG